MNNVVPKKTMQPKQIELLQRFYMKCYNSSGCYCFEVEGKAYILESEPCVQELVNAILVASKEVQQSRLSQASNWIHRAI